MLLPALNACLRGVNSVLSLIKDERMLLPALYACLRGVNSILSLIKDERMIFHALNAFVCIPQKSLYL